MWSSWLLAHVWLPTRVTDLDSEQQIQRQWLKGWYFFLHIIAFFSSLPFPFLFFSFLESFWVFFPSWMNHLSHMGCEGKPFVPKFSSSSSKLQLSLITMVTCCSAPWLGAPVNANQLRTGKGFLFLLTYKKSPHWFLLLKSHFPIDCSFSFDELLSTALGSANTKCSRGSLANKPKFLTRSLPSKSWIDSKHIHHLSSFIQRTAQVAGDYGIHVIK